MCSLKLSLGHISEKKIGFSIFFNKLLWETAKKESHISFDISQTLSYAVL